MKHLLLFAVLLLATITLALTPQASTPEHPNHAVLLDRLQVAAADNGKYLGIVNAKVQPVAGGGGVPIFVDNATLNGAAGLPLITLDRATGQFTLPSIPSPQTSLCFTINGLTQQMGRDYSISGKLVTPLAGSVEIYKNAATAVAHYRQ